MSSEPGKTLSRSQELFIFFELNTHTITEIIMIPVKSVLAKEGCVVVIFTI